MDRKRTYKIVKTPEASFFPDTDNTLFFDTPRPSVIPRKPILKETEENKSYLNKSLNRVKKIEYIKIMKNYILYIVLIAVIIIQYKKNDSIELETLKNHIDQIVIENNELLNKFEKINTSLNKTQKQILDYADIRNGAYINYKKTSKPYKYGFFNLKTGNDPSYVLIDNLNKGECFAFSGDKGNITIMFDKPIKIKEIVIIHPMTDNRKSAIKDFELIGLNNDETNLGEFTYHLNEKIMQKFIIENEDKFNGLNINILNNHGNKKYTAVYKIYVFGY